MKAVLQPSVQMKTKSYRITKGFLPLWHGLKRDGIVSNGFGLLMRDGIQKNTNFHRRYNSNHTTIGKT